MKKKYELWADNSKEASELFGALTKKLGKENITLISTAAHDPVLVNPGGIFYEGEGYIRSIFEI